MLTRVFLLMTFPLSSSTVLSSSLQQEDGVSCGLCAIRGSTARTHVRSFSSRIISCLYRSSSRLSRSLSLSPSIAQLDSPPASSIALRRKNSRQTLLPGPPRPPPTEVSSSAYLILMKASLIASRMVCACVCDIFRRSRISCLRSFAFFCSPRSWLYISGVSCKSL